MKSAILIVLQLAAAGSDAYFTHRNQSMPRHYENNPIAAPFIGSTHGQVIYFSAWAGGRIILERILVRHHHPKWAKAVAIEAIADNGLGAAWSATH